MGNWTSKRRAVLAAAVSVAVVIVGLTLPTFVGGWAPINHWTCQPSTTVLRETVQIPALLLNSPYGGNASGTVALPSGFVPGDIAALTTEDSNGGADWAGFEATLTVRALENESSWGPGANVRCAQEYGVALAPDGDTSLGIPLLGPGNVSDSQEPTVLVPGGVTSLDFSNGFTAANSETISTCGGPAQSLPPITATHLALWATFGADGQRSTVPFDLPIVDSEFQYSFPAGAGTWQVDDLSAPGGPGGGWAFSYSPCA
jgi:hypothetical protein